MDTAHDAVGAALLRAAHAVLATDGAAALTVRRIAQEAGVSTMNVYSRFGGKDGVIEELFVDGFERLGAALRACPETDHPLDDLRACRGIYRRFALDNPTYYTLMFERAVPEYVPSQRAGAVANGTLGLLARRVDRAIVAGHLASADPWSVAIGLWSACHGLVSLELKGVGPGGGAPGDPECAIDTVDWQRTYDDTLEHLLVGYVRGTEPAAAREPAAGAPVAR